MRAPLSIYEVFVWAVGPALALIILAVGCLPHSLRELRFFAAYLVFFILRELTYFYLSNSRFLGNLRLLLDY